MPSAPTAAPRFEPVAESGGFFVGLRPHAAKRMGSMRDSGVSGTLRRRAECCRACLCPRREADARGKAENKLKRSQREESGGPELLDRAP